MKYIAVLAVAAVLATPAAEDDGRVYRDRDAYEIYSSLIPEHWLVAHAKAKELVLSDVTATHEMCLIPEGESKKLIGPAIEAFDRENKTRRRLDHALRLDLPYKFVPHGELTVLRWQDFDTLYPDARGWLEFSAVGFNNERTVAIVYLAHHCGGLCGGGGFRVLQKKDGRWLPLKWKGSACAWAS